MKKSNSKTSNQKPTKNKTITLGCQLLSTILTITSILVILSNLSRQDKISIVEKYYQNLEQQKLATKQLVVERKIYERQLQQSVKDLKDLEDSFLEKESLAQNIRGTKVEQAARSKPETKILQVETARTSIPVVQEQNISEKITELPTDLSTVDLPGVKYEGILQTNAKYVILSSSIPRLASQFKDFFEVFIITW